MVYSLYHQSKCGFSNCISRTVLRELLQNAADASASKVTITFETIPSSTVPVPKSADSSSALKHVVAHHTLKRLLVSNNGQPFNDNDWSRLKRIAEGNPDETKIGAFGVGFYSVFADCEEPFVSSGREAMAFYWKGNSLFTRRSPLSDSDANPNTNFVLDYRNTTSPVPALLPLCQFLASSLTFVGIQDIELWIDGWNVLHLTKKVAPSVAVPIPEDVETKTEEGLMKVTKVSREVAQLDAKCMKIMGWKLPRSSPNRYEGGRAADTGLSVKSFFSKLTGNLNGSAFEDTIHETRSVPDLTEDVISTSITTIFLHINTATIRTSITHSFGQELERATKKPAPKTTTLAVLTSSYDGGNPGALSTPGKSIDIFETVLPTRSGRIFIGFPTHQTTGLNAHISAPSVIPTVERESIDLNARWVRTWNLELLRASGIVCRIAWAAEMSMIKDKIDRLLSASGKTKVRRDEIEKVLPEAIHTSNQFTFRESTPSSQIGRKVEDAFWTCSKKASIDILSTCGVLPTFKVRLAPKELSFMHDIPALPDAFVDGAKEFVNKLIEYGLVSEISVQDIKAALEASALTGEQLGEFLTWIGRKAVAGDVDRNMIQSLLQVAIANDELEEGKGGRVIVLGEIKCFLNETRIPPTLPVPSNVMPFKYTRYLARNILEALGWEELQIVPWIRWLIENSGDRHIIPLEHDMTRTAAFSAQILPILSKQWDHLSQSSKGTVIELLQPKTIIPTKLGMRAPPYTYFPSVKLFDDLPTVQGLNSVKEKFLAAIGVRKTVELEVIFDRLLANPSAKGEEAKLQAKWSHVELIKYLASVREDIPAADIERLRNTPICPADNREQTGGNTLLFKVSELFEPRPYLRELRLPIIQWPGPYRGGSAEGKFLSFLGLKSYPTAQELVDIMAKSGAGGNRDLRDSAMNFFIANHHQNGYAAFDCSKVTKSFLPINNSDDLYPPSRCFTDEGAALFGYKILRRDLHPHALKFGVRQHPSIVECLNILIKTPPVTQKEAQTKYTYFAGRLPELNSSIVDMVSKSKIVPIILKNKSANGFMLEKSPAVRYVAPQNCFLGDSDQYQQIFDFVDFGSEANAFLLKCGSKHQPNKTEVAWMLVREPARVSGILQSTEKYLTLLKSLAESREALKKDKDLWRQMKSASFLLGSREVSAPAQPRTDMLIDLDDGSDDEDERTAREWVLTTAGETIIVDEYASFNLFKEKILAAPQDEALEELYYSLGAPLLGSLVEEQAKFGVVVPDQRSAEKLQTLLLERSRLFLHDHASDMVKHDAKWLEKNVRVRTVSSITLRRSLKGRNISHQQKRSAVITTERGSRIMSITSPYDVFQVSQAIVNIMLTRPKLHSILTFEMLLKTDLYELRARGYNVSRILRQKAAEARIAEDQRLKQLEEERKEIQAKEQQWKEAQEQADGEQADRITMPGVFPDSPDRTLPPRRGSSSIHIDTPSDRRPRGLFSNLTRHLGFDQNTPASRHVQNLLGHNTPQPNQDGPSPYGTENPPPPYSHTDPTSQPNPSAPAPEPVTSPHRLHQNLLSAISASRAHNSSTLFTAPQTNLVKETTSYCDERPSHDLTFIADSAPGLQIFLDKSIAAPSPFISSNVQSLNAFATLLIDCADIFAMNPASLNIFYDPSGRTIAFNRQGSVFANFRYFKQLHEGAVLAGDRREALVYWFVILCHELAHNLVADHSSNHSFYT
jgi:Protein of unknown function (DUF3684)